MARSILGVISKLGRKIDEPIFIKDYEDSSKTINELEEIYQSIKDDDIRKKIEMDILFIKAGDQGERNVYYELKNSFLPMLVLHNVVIQYDDYKAQMDYILITKKFICILETKKLNGHITINSDGDFIRTFTDSKGKVYKKEGMYSPISQNQRHVRILKNLLLREKVIRKTPIISLVVIANPKSIINMKYAKKQVKQQIVKYDQLTSKLKGMINHYNDIDLATRTMYNMANFLLESHVESENTFINKYKEHIENSETDADKNIVESNEQAIGNPEKETIENVKEASVSYSDKKDIDTLRKLLVEFRLEQSRKEKIKAYYIFNNNQMEDILRKMPKTTDELLECQGFSPVKVKKYGDVILRILRS
jgi:hypothetical protein